MFKDYSEVQNELLEKCVQNVLDLRIAIRIQDNSDFSVVFCWKETYSVFIKLTASEN